MGRRVPPSQKPAESHEEGDGKKPMKPKDPHYADKGGHGARHNQTFTTKELAKLERKGKGWELE